MINIKFMKNILLILLFFICRLIYAEQITGLYSTNYPFNATITLDKDDSNNKYELISTIKIPFYNIKYKTIGTIQKNTFWVNKYEEYRNEKLYANAEKKGNVISYGKQPEVDKENTKLPMYDLFSLAFQMVLADDKIPKDFIITTGKKLYPIHNQHLRKTEKVVTDQDGKNAIEKTFLINIDKKKIILKSMENVQFPTYIEFEDKNKKYKLTLKNLIK